MPIIEGGSTIDSGTAGRVRTAVGNYSFAVDGGVVGDITLRGDTIPSGAVIIDSLIKVTTAVTGGGSATLAIKAEGAADINAADAVSGAPWSTTGAKRGDHTATSAPITTTAARSIVATVGTAALTAGAFKVVVFYVSLGSSA